jgi:teichuronic acid biosynthesis glycosyltransferase TuaC
MKILVVTSNYPYTAYRFAGIFNHRSVMGLAEKCETVEVLAPRPYVPPVLSRVLFAPRWKAYATIRGYEVRDGVPIYRPAYLHIPRLRSAFWTGAGAFLSCRQLAREMHKRVGFDAIVSFDLLAAGGLAWRLGADLGIPASGWATGELIQAKTLKRLDLVYYQSRELFEEAAGVLKVCPDSMPPEKHVVLPRGILEPPSLPRADARKRARLAWGATDEHIVVLSIGRITRAKGVFELLEALSLVMRADPRVICVMIGSNPAFDETAAVQKMFHRTPNLRDRVRLLPACSPDVVPEYLCGADMFAFCSHKEGMPNALLEAMAMGIPAVAFAIAPVLEIDAEREALVTVPPFDSTLFAKAILRLVASPDDRARIAESGKARVQDRFMMRKNIAQALQLLTEMIYKRRHAMRKVPSQLVDDSL